MRIIVSVTAVLIALLLAAPGAQARRAWYPWCAWLADGIEAGSCAYSTLEQCWTTVRGVGGYCGMNPYPPPPLAPPGPRWKPIRGYYR
jgi:hypothetical protein